MHDIVSRIRERIAAAPLHEEPFPHLVVDDFLPEPTYAEFMERWPAQAAFTINRSRERWNLDVGRLTSRASAEEAAFWNDVLAWSEAANHAIATRLAPCLGSKFGYYFGRRWREEVRNLTLVGRGARLAYYTGRIGLAPHVDHVSIVTNAFLYLSESDAEEPALGTVLYRSLGLALPTNINLVPSIADLALRKAAVASYRRNRCLAYVNGPMAFHGVEPTDIGARERRLLMFGNLLTRESGLAIFGERLMQG